MRYFYDCEFLDDGSTIDLISIGIVCEDGREYYAVNSDFDINRIKNDDWMLRNVIPHLPLVGRTSLDSYIAKAKNFYPKPPLALLGLDQKSALVKPKWVIANEVRDFLLWQNPISSNIKEPELWAYYGAYDHVALAQLWGPMISLPRGIPMWTHDLMQALEHVDVKKPEQDGSQHDALTDARWNMKLYNTIMEQGYP